MINGKKVFVVIMAAGKGTRIGATDRPKVMFEVAGKPIIDWAIKPFDDLKQEGLVDRVITVVGFLGNQVIDYLVDKSEYVWQKDQLGTAHAVRQAEALIENEEGYTLIVNGDHPLYDKETFKLMVEKAISNELTLGFAVVNNPDRFDSYGRVARDAEGKVQQIIEVPEATEAQKKLPERSINLYVVDNKWLFTNLPKIKMSSVKKEYYIVDIVKMAIDQGKKVEAIQINDENEALGINTLEDKEEAEKILKNRSNS